MELIGRHSWHFHLQIDAVQQGSGDTRAISGHLVGSAATLEDKLRLYRVHRGLSHKAMARILGVDPGSISGGKRVSAGRRNRCGEESLTQCTESSSALPTT
jgi:hypothetical protein